MDDYGSLSQTKWDCKYHVVFIPKCRRKVLYGELRKHLGEVFRGLAEQKESRIVEGHIWPGSIWGEEAELRRAALWARGYFVSTVGRDERLIREYIRNQEEEDKRLDQMDLWS